LLFPALAFRMISDSFQLGIFVLASERESSAEQNSPRRFRALPLALPLALQGQLHHHCQVHYHFQESTESCLSSRFQHQQQVIRLLLRWDHQHLQRTSLAGEPGLRIFNGLLWPNLLSNAPRTPSWPGPTRVRWNHREHAPHAHSKSK